MGESNVCNVTGHMRSDGAAVWRCDCGTRMCQGCFEILTGAGGVVLFSQVEAALANNGQAH